jgi:hypothetical protein
MDDPVVPRLGIDIGGVIMEADNDAFFGPFGTYREQAMLKIPELPGSVEAIGRLIQLFGTENVWLVSKANKNSEAKSLRWLAHHNFYARTGLLKTHVYCCRVRPDKAAICDWLDIGYFVDDRPDVLTPMDGIVPHRYLFGPQLRWPVSLMGITMADNWRVAEKAIRSDLPV